MSVRSARYNRLSLRNPKGTSALPLERDAWAFLDAAGITSSRQQEAIITLVRDLKQANLWSKMAAIYPFVGGTATAHKFNLKDPRDANAGFRLTFNGGWTHSSTGALGNGSNAWANTNMNCFTNLTNGDFSISCYVRQGTIVSAYEGEINVNANPYIPAGLLGLRAYNRNIGLAQFNGGNDTTEGAAASSTTMGYALGSEESNSSRKFYKNNTLLATNTTLSTSALKNDNLWLMWGGYQYAASELAFVHAGSSLTSAQASLMYLIVDRYQKFLGRAV